MAVLLLAGFVPRLVENRIKNVHLSVNKKIEQKVFFFTQQKSPLTGLYWEKFAQGMKKARW